MPTQSDTFRYSIAIFNAIVLAVLTFFFPLHSGSAVWSSLVIYFLLLFCNVIYMAKDELKKKKHRTFNETLGYAYCYVIEVAMIAFIFVIILCRYPQEKLDVSNLGDCLIYLMLFLLHLQLVTLSLIGGEKGARPMYVPFLGLLCSLGCMFLFYYEMKEPGMQLPSYAQSIAFVLLIPNLLRLRVMESYGHF